MKSYITWGLIFRNDFVFLSCYLCTFGTVHSEESIASGSLPMRGKKKKKTFFAPLPLPSNCLTSLWKRATEHGLLLAFATHHSEQCHSIRNYVSVCPFTEFQSSTQWASDYPNYSHIRFAAVIYPVFPSCHLSCVAC